MGWTYICRPLRHDETPDSYLREKSGALNWSKHDDATGDRHEVIASAMVGSVWYGALKITYASTPGTSRVVALVFLTSQRKGEGFGWKDMSEDMGPNECDCPKRILDLLTPTESEYAREWRDRCNARRSEKARQRKVISALTPGTVIRFGHPITFKSGRSSDTFKVIKSPYTKGIAFTLPNDAGLFKLPTRILAAASIVEGGV